MICLNSILFIFIFTCRAPLLGFGCCSFGSGLYLFQQASSSSIQPCNSAATASKRAKVNHYSYSRFIICLFAVRHPSLVGWHFILCLPIVGIMPPSHSLILLIGITRMSCAMIDIVYVIIDKACKAGSCSDLISSLPINFIFQHIKPRETILPFKELTQYVNWILLLLGLIVFFEPFIVVSQLRSLTILSSITI